ncbi:MAG: hypothetical protein Q8Q17_01655 [bacterium]|nr:hypothetical protein [bacterium]
MADQEKPFDTASVVLLLLVAGSSDIADLATDLLFPVPIIGQVVFVFNSLVVSPIVWAIIQFSFIMKTGMGRASLVAVAGGLGNIANIPGSETVTTLLAISIANNPKISEVSGALSAAEGKVGGGAKKAGAGAAAKESGAAAENETEAARMPKKGAGAESGQEEAGDRAAKKSGGAGEAEAGISPEALGEEPEPMEKLQQKLLSETPPEGNVKIDDRNNEIDLRRK